MGTKEEIRKENREYEKRRREIQRERKALLRKRPWLQLDCEVSEEALDYIVEYYSDDLPKSALEVRCLRGLNVNQLMFLRGRISEEKVRWYRESCEIEAYLASCAEEAFSGRDFTFSLIYRYLTDSVINEVLKIK